MGTRISVLEICKYSICTMKKYKIKKTSSGPSPSPCLGCKDTGGSMADGMRTPRGFLGLCIADARPSILPLDQCDLSVRVVTTQGL